MNDPLKFHIGLNLLRSQLFEIRALHYLAFFEISFYLKKIERITISMSEEVILWNKIGRNFNILVDIQDFQKFCPNFDSLFLWNRSTKNTKSFINKHYIFWNRTQNSKGSNVKSRYNRIKLIQTSQKIEFPRTVGHIQWLAKTWI